MGHHDSQLEGIIWVEEDAVKAIGQIILGQEQGAFGRVCMSDEPKQPGQHATKLHDFTG